MHTRSLAIVASLSAAAALLPARTFGALAAKAGKAGTSSTTSSSPTAKQQANLMDPVGEDPAGTPLEITFARLDIDIHYDNLPPTFQADNIIRSISVSPFVNNDPSDPNFQPGQTGYGFQASTRPGDSLPSYNYDIATNSVTDQHNVVFQGTNDVLLHDIAVQLDPGFPAPNPGEINLAEVHVQYFDFQAFGGTNYEDIVATFTTTIDESEDGLPASEIDGVDSFGNISIFTDGDIIPSSSSQTLGGVDVPEPAMIGSLGILAALGVRRRRNSEI